MRIRSFCTAALLVCNPLRPAPAQATSRGDCPPLRTMVDVGGYRVHLYCTGAGSPTVMIVGAGYSFDWGLVQPAASKTTRVCSYDPAGSAWSDPAPERSTCEQHVEEVHTLLYWQLEPVGDDTTRRTPAKHGTKAPGDFIHLTISHTAGVLPRQEFAGYTTAGHDATDEKATAWP